MSGFKDDRVIDLVGYFNETLWDDRIGDLAMVRFDGDMHASTLQVDTCRINMLCVPLCCRLYCTHIYAYRTQNFMV
jgi:hypothetical protein